MPSSAISARASSSDGVIASSISTVPVDAVSKKRTAVHQSARAPGTRSAETAKASTIASEKVAATR